MRFLFFLTVIFGCFCFFFSWGETGWMWEIFNLIYRNCNQELFWFNINEEFAEFQKFKLRDDCWEKLLHVFFFSFFFCLHSMRSVQFLVESAAMQLCNSNRNRFRWIGSKRKSNSTNYKLSQMSELTDFIFFSVF